MEDFAREGLEESDRLKEKACENCMRELEGDSFRGTNAAV